MDYRIAIRDPAGNHIRIDAGYVSDKGEYTYDFRGPGIVPGGGAIIGTMEIRWDRKEENGGKCWCTNHQYCQCTKHPHECPGSWHRNKNWSGRAECDECISHND